MSERSRVPLLSYEGDVELVPLQLLAGVGHHLVEGALQQVVPPHNQPGTHRRNEALLNTLHTVSPIAQIPLWKQLLVIKCFIPEEEG